MAAVPIRLQLRNDECQAKVSRLTSIDGVSCQGRDGLLAAARGEAGASCLRRDSIRVAEERLISISCSAPISCRYLGPGKLEPGLRQCHSCAQASGRGAPPRRAERAPESGPAPCYLRTTGRKAQSQHQRALTFAVGSKPRSVSVSVCVSTPVLCTSSQSLSVLEAEPAYSLGRHPSRPRASVRTHVSRLSPQWAASVPSFKPPLLLEVLGGEKVGACLGKG
ncbi:hypothetical protein NDU88_003534 [Pleurodeles waltl]|uniref:Uncharacterized protein n=1 Tax=Pleurodeles waltl TaxID=8319 RepID=A0AAV7LFM1_PLEWA|nr:hypothetical protein NDU88_003534 [Pleurodeles waltl]